MGGDQFLRLREAYLPNLSLLIWISHLVFIYSLWIGLGAVPWVGRGGGVNGPYRGPKRDLKFFESF